MKRQMTRLVLAGALALLSITVPSCKQGCQECTCQEDGTTDVFDICRENYETQQQYKAVLTQFENGTYGDCVCTKE